MHRSLEIGWIRCTQCGWGAQVDIQDVESGDYADRQACPECCLGPCRIEWNYPHMQIKAIEQLIGGRQERTVKVDNITITIVPTDGYEPGKAPPRRQVAGIPRGWHFRINGGRWIQWRGEERSSLETTKAMAALFSLLYEYHLLGELGKPAT